MFEFCYILKKFDNICFDSTLGQIKSICNKGTSDFFPINSKATALDLIAWLPFKPLLNFDDPNRLAFALCL